MPSKRVNISQMKIGEGQLHEIYLDSGARITCPPELIPAPGQYLLAHAPASDSPLAVPVFFSDSAPNGFRSAPLLDSSWLPGTRLNLRGPIGHGFLISASARKVALIAFDDSPARLRGLISIALKQEAEIVLVCNLEAAELPESEHRRERRRSTARKSAARNLFRLRRFASLGHLWNFATARQRGRRVELHLQLYRNAPLTAHARAAGSAMRQPVASASAMCRLHL